MNENSEIGEELTISDLVLDTVVVLRAIHRPDIAVTAWVKMIHAEAATFWMGETRTGLVLRVAGDKFFDDMNHRIYVHRYKGEV